MAQHGARSSARSPQAPRQRPSRRARRRPTAPRIPAAPRVPLSSRAARSPWAALVRAVLVAALVAAGPGASALGVARSMRWRARPFRLDPAPTAPDLGSWPAGILPARGLPPGALPEVVRQSTPRSCGPAALASMLAWLGRPVGEAAVLERARLRADGVTLDELARLAAAFEVPAGWYVASARALPRLPMPAIAHLRRRGGHFVALYRVARGFVLLADPAGGLVIERLTRFRRGWSGRVLLPARGAGGSAGSRRRGTP